MQPFPPHLLQSSFDLHLSRAKCLSWLIGCMLALGEVNLAKLCAVFSSAAKPDSRYRRLRRFMDEVSLCQRTLARFVVAIMGLADGSWTLSMDRTNWKIGKVHVNILYLCLCHGKMGIPLFWSFLEDKKQGNSDHLDRIDLLELFIETFGKERIAVLTMDREFIGKYWVEDFLQAQDIAYVVRLKEAGYMANGRGRQVKMEQLFHPLQPGETVSLGARKTGKAKEACTHYITALRSHKGELVVLAHSADITDAGEQYRKRWDIEVMFRAFKSGGFNLEDTRITHPDRLHTLTQVMAIAFCIAYTQGNTEHNQKPPTLKKHGYPPRSRFRTGLDIFRNLYANAKRTWNKTFKKIEITIIYKITKLTEIENVR